MFGSSIGETMCSILATYEDCVLNMYFPHPLFSLISDIDTHQSRTAISARAHEYKEVVRRMQSQHALDVKNLNAAAEAARADAERAVATRLR
jgi:hypothetical protein